jgi:hypothetical protein
MKYSIYLTLTALTIQLTTIMSWTKPGKPTRAVFLYVLNVCPEARNKYFSSGEIAELCNYAAGLDGTHGVDSLLVGRAFSRGAVREYTIPSFNSLVPEDSERTRDHLHAYISEYLVSDGDRITAVGRFSSESERSRALEAFKSRLASNNDSRSHPFRRWSDIAAIRDSDVGKAFREKYGGTVIKSVSARASERKRSSTPRPIGDGDTEDQAAKRQKTMSKLEKLKKKLTKYEEKAVEYKQLINKTEGDVEAMDIDDVTGTTATAPTQQEYANEEGLVNIIMNGRAICVPRNKIIHLSDIEKCLSSEEPSKLFDGGYILKRAGKKGKHEYLIPRSGRHEYNRRERHDKYMRKLRKLMKYKKCMFSDEAKRYLSLGCHANSGGSDEAAMKIMHCTMRAILHEMGVPEEYISNEMIANAFPSRPTLRNMELSLGEDCLIRICYEMIEDEVKYVSWMFDHGSRKKLNHFFKQISYGAFDADGCRRVIKSYCIDSNVGGHTAEESAESIEIVINLLKILLPDVQHDSATSDSGGGAAVQHVFKQLVKKGLMSKGSRKNHCDLHALNKALERALIAALGNAGIDHNTPMQMLHLAFALMKELTARLGKKGMDEIWAQINDKLLNSPLFQFEATEHGGLSFTAFYDEIMSHLDDEDLDYIVDSLNHIPGSRKDPVFSRWLTILTANSTFIEHYFTIYILAMQIRDMENSGSLLHTYACKLLSLMQIKPDASGDDNSPPVFYVVLLFLQGFNDAFFNEHFERRMKSNSDFGEGTYGFLSPYCVEHAGLMHLDLKKLEKGKFKQHPAFAKYVEARDGIPEDDNVAGAGSAYFDKMEEVIFNEFRAALDEHCIDHWRDDSHLPYCIGGSPEIMKAFIQWLSHECKTSEEDESISVANDESSSVANDEGSK